MEIYLWIIIKGSAEMSQMLVIVIIQQLIGVVVVIIACILNKTVYIL